MIEKPFEDIDEKVFIEPRNNKYKVRCYSCVDLTTNNTCSNIIGCPKIDEPYESGCHNGRDIREITDLCIHFNGELTYYCEKKRVIATKYTCVGCKDFKSRKDTWLMRFLNKFFRR